MPNSPSDEQRINTIRFLAVDAVQKANSGHPGMPMGAAAMAYTLWTRHLRFNPEDPHWFNRDRFVLSAGHGSMLLYALLYLTGYDLTLDDLKNFRQLDSKTPGHPEAERTPGVEATTGPLGQGFANAVGMAIAEAQLGAVYNRPDQPIVDHYTYCLCGDGDLMEGISQEALSLAGHLKLGKLIVFYDDNRVSLAGPTDVTLHRRSDRALRRERLAHAAHRHRPRQRRRDDRPGDHGREKRNRSAIVHRGADAHRLRFAPRKTTISRTAKRSARRTSRRPKRSWAGRSSPTFYVPDDVLEFYRDDRREGRARCKRRLAARRTTRGSARMPISPRSSSARCARTLPANLPWPTFTAENGSVATRDAGGAVMNAIAMALPELVGGSGGPRSVDQDLPQELRRLRARQLRRAQHSLRCARACDGGRHERDLAARRTVAVRGNVLQLSSTT